MSMIKNIFLLLILASAAIAFIFLSNKSAPEQKEVIKEIKYKKTEETQKK